jgi:hypothetical protein
MVFFATFFMFSPFYSLKVKGKAQRRTLTIQRRALTQLSEIQEIC